MEVHSTNRSRRSFPNLQHLSLAPLSSRFPIDGNDYEEDAPEETDTRSLSYIQSKTAPTTPSILSRSSSRKRNGKRRSARNVQDGYFPPATDMSEQALSKKAKSAVNLESQGRRNQSRTSMGGSTTLLSPLTTRQPQRSSDAGDEWLHRAGLAIASEMRENKGQSWLVTRDSSTSLAAHASGHVTMMSGEQLADDEDSPLDPIYSHTHSRSASRLTSARNSRRGSMVGASRVGFMTPLDAKTPGSAFASDGYFDDMDVIAEPDFVEAEDDGVVDDEEVSRLARQKGIGFGGLVDKLVGFSLFNVDEDAEETEDDEHTETAEEAINRKQAELKKRREQLAKAASSSADATTRGEEAVGPAKQGEEGGWQDAAWLLSVASKVLY